MVVKCINRLPLSCFGDAIFGMYIIVGVPLRGYCEGSGQDGGAFSRRICTLLHMHRASRSSCGCPIIHEFSTTVARDRGRPPGSEPQHGAKAFAFYVAGAIARQAMLQQRELEEVSIKPALYETELQLAVQWAGRTGPALGLQRIMGGFRE